MHGPNKWGAPWYSFIILLPRFGQYVNFLTKVLRTLMIKRSRKLYLYSEKALHHVLELCLASGLSWWLNGAHFLASGWNIFQMMNVWTKAYGFSWSKGTSCQQTLKSWSHSVGWLAQRKWSAKGRSMRSRLSLRTFARLTWATVPSNAFWRLTPPSLSR